LKNLDATNTTYVRQADETLAKTYEKHLKTIVKHTQHSDKTFTTYA
jgi:hypothetical protein